MRAPRSIGPYEIVRLLDAGGMGKVYLAREREGVAAGRLVVVKTIRSELERSPEHVASFQREARVLAHLRHPNVVQLYDAGRTGQRLYMAMEYLEGLDLAKALRLLAGRGGSRGDGRVPLGVALHVGREIALALDAAHAWRGPDGPAGLVHRDLSPHNVFLLFGGGVKLLDFGLARTYGEVSTTRTGMVKGKFRYLAPEQARGEPLDARVDLFTLGLVLHEMISGRRAYEQHGDVDILRAAMAGDFPRLSEIAPDVPEAVRAVVERAVAKDPADRHPTALALAEDLRNAADEAGIGGDSLSLRKLMEEVRALAEHAPAPALDSGEQELSPSGSAYLGASQIASVADVVASIRPAPPPVRRAERRTWGAAALAAIGVASLVGALAVSRAAAPAARELAASPPSASVFAPAPVLAVESAAPSAPSAAAEPSLTAAPPRAVPQATPPVAPKSKDRRVVKPKHGVGTGVVADYP